MSARVVLRAREEARPLAESVRAARGGHLLLDAKGQALVRVIEKGEGLPISLLMVHSPDFLEEARFYANWVAEYVRLGVEQFLDDRRREAKKNAEKGALTLSMWDEKERQVVLVAASESCWGALSMSRLFPWPWPVASSPSPDEPPKTRVGRNECGRRSWQVITSFSLRWRSTSFSAGAGSPSPIGSASTAWRSCYTRGAIRRSRIRRRAG